MTTTIDPLTWCLQANAALHRTWLTADAIDVLVALSGFIAIGHDTPTHGELADVARCGKRNVRRVLTIARERGFLDWTPPSGQGAANTYRLCLPVLP